MRLGFLLLIFSVLILGSHRWHLQAGTSLEAINSQNIERLVVLATILPEELPRNPVYEIVFDPASTLLAYRSAEQFILWDIAAQETRWSLPMRYGSGVAFSPDGHGIAVTGNFSTYFFNDLADSRSWQKLLWESNNSFSTGSEVRFSGLGDEIVALIEPDYGIFRWQAGTGELSFEVFEPSLDERSLITDIRLNSDGSIAALFGRLDDVIEFVDTTDGFVISLVSPYNLVDERSAGRLSVDFLSFAPDDQQLLTLISASDWSGPILIFLTTAGEMTQQMRYDYEVFWTAGVFSPDGSLLILANAADQSLYFFDPTGTEQFAVIPSGDEGLRTLAISPDGTLLATGSTDGTVRLWGVPAGGE